MKSICSLSVAALLFGLSAGGMLAAGTGHSARATYQGVVLRLSVHTDGSIVKANAVLSNKSTHPFDYYGGCAPPVLQIQAYNGVGKHIFGWTKPEVQCMALAPKQLLPGKSLKAKGSFSAHGNVLIKALARTESAEKFETKSIKLTLP